MKEIERTTNHDVKAIEYFIKEQISDDEFGPVLEFVHFGLTSQDINNSAQPLALKEALHDQWRPRLDKVVHEINQRAEEWADIPMLARTHGQPASPTTLGKEMRVYGYRLERQLALLDLVPQTIKFGGATGNMNAHHVAYPEIDWRNFANHFAHHLGMGLEEYTTQISNYDNLAALLDGLKRISTILIDFCRDIWMYVSMEYFKQKIKEGEVGSSAMPHKVNPIDFENALPVVAEALQTILRREGYPKPYEALKKLTRTNEKLTREHLEDFIDHLDVNPEVKEEMKKITPRNYTGVYSK